MGLGCLCLLALLVGYHARDIRTVMAGLFTRTPAPTPAHTCPRCGTPTVHLCAMVCVDMCPVCDRLGRTR